MKTNRIPTAVPFVQKFAAAVSSRLHLHLAAFLILAILFAAACAKEPEGPFYRVADRSYSTVSGAVFKAINSQVFLVGEHHDNPLHHRTQLEIIREIHEKAEKPMAIGLEMFETRYQEELNRWVAGSLGLGEFLQIYYSNWDFPWVLYRDIFLYAREHEIPLVALNIPREVTRKVARQGFDSLNPEELALLPQGVTCDVTQDYETFIQRVFDWHGKKDNSFKNFCEAQVLWDAIMAANLLKYHELTPATKLVVLAGGGHAWKPGIPRQISMRKDLEITVFLPETHQLHRKNVSARDTDFLRLFSPGRKHRG